MQNQVSKLQTEKPQNRYLWKFFDLFKFIAFIQETELFFSRLDYVDDYLEGSDIESNSIIRTIARTQNKTRINELLTVIAQLKRIQKKFYASCFFSSNDESIAMWSLYSQNKGIAIRFDSMQLLNYILEKAQEVNDLEVFFGKIEYENSSTRFLRRLAPTDKDKLFNPFLKDRAYIHEDEFRILFYQETNLDTSGIKIKIDDLTKLNFKIFVPNETKKWEKNVIEKLIKKYGINERVIVSDIIMKETVQGLILDSIFEK